MHAADGSHQGGPNEGISKEMPPGSGVGDVVSGGGGGGAGSGTIGSCAFCQDDEEVMMCPLCSCRRCYGKQDPSLALLCEVRGYPLHFRVMCCWLFANSPKVAVGTCRCNRNVLAHWF